MTETSFVQQLSSLVGARIDAPQLVSFFQHLKLDVPGPTADGDDTEHVVDEARGLEFAFSHRVTHRDFWPARKEARKYVTYLKTVWFKEGFDLPFPSGLRWKMTREEVEARLGPPAAVNSKLLDFEVPVSDRARLSVRYDMEEGAMRHVLLTIRETSNLTSNPLSFEKEPPEGAPAHARGLATGMLLAWAADRVGLAEKHQGGALATKLAAREITGATFVREACDGALFSDDLSPVFGDFLRRYVLRLFSPSNEWKEARKAENQGPDSLSFKEDYLACFKGAVTNPFLVPDTWEAFDRFAPMLDARWEDFRKTAFQQAPPAGLYERARELQRQRPVAAP